MIEIKAPAECSPHADKFKIFLAGSIDMGDAPDWQKDLAAALCDTDTVLLNPRRESWDVSWKQSSDNPVFKEQVEWELQGLEDADLIAVYFAPGSKAPISMLELGIHLGKNPGKIIVCCPDEFYRKGNLDITCQRYGARLVETFEELVLLIKGRLLPAKEG